MAKSNNTSTGSEISEDLDGEQHAQSDQSVQSNQRRKAVRNILAGSGLTLGAATAGSWVKPVVNAVILPSHAQTSVPVPVTVVLAGNASVSAVVGINPNKLPGSSSVLDFFIGPANAIDDAPVLSGACLTMTVPGDGTFSLSVEFAIDPAILVFGSVSAGSIDGSGGGLNVIGTIDLAASTPFAMGTISNGQDTHSFTIDSATSGCTPISTTPAPSPSTTPEPRPTPTTSLPGPTTSSTSTSPRMTASPTHPPSTSSTPPPTTPLPEPESDEPTPTTSSTPPPPPPER